MTSTDPMQDLRDRVDALSVETGKQSVVLSQQSEVLLRIDHAVNGNGKPGLKIEVDRLKRSHKIGVAVVAIVFTAAVGAWIDGKVNTPEDKTPQREMRK